jgi:SAM-dependent methyltransferase
MTEPFTRISEFYDGLVERYGHDPKACDYGSRESQAIKFKVLSEVNSLKGKTLLDVGCGFADYGQYLQHRYEQVKYAGIDLSPAMIAEGRRLHPEFDLSICNLFDQPCERQFDVVSANGIFYLLGEQAPELMRKLVSHMFSLARVAVTFNSLSTWAPARESGEFYADPAATLEWCHELTPWVTMRHDYHPRDFTVYLYKRRNA